MNIIIDAHLPKALCSYFEAQGCKAMHTSHLEMGNATEDMVINQIALEQEAVVISSSGHI